MMNSTSWGKAALSLCGLVFWGPRACVLRVNADGRRRQSLRVVGGCISRRTTIADRRCGLEWIAIQGSEETAPSLRAQMVTAVQIKKRRSSPSMVNLMIDIFKELTR